MLKFYLQIVGVITLMTAINLPLSSKEGKIFPYDYKVKTLDNGLKVYVIPMASEGLASYYTIVRTGSVDEVEQGKTGFAHFFEHMMFRGTKKYPKTVYDSIVVSLGADANAYTTDDYTCYHLNIATEDLERVIDIESERFQHLSYLKPDFQTESGAVYGEYRKNLTIPIENLITELVATAFKVHTYGHTTIGYEADIKDMPNQYEYSKEFYKRFYRPENCVIVVCGDVNSDKTFKMIEEYYGNWEKGYQKPNIPTEPQQTEPRRSTFKYPGKTNPMIAIGYKGETFDPANKNVIATQLLGQLVFGSSSEISKKLYVKEGKVLEIAPSFEMNRFPALWLIYAILQDPNDLTYVENEILNTVKQFQEHLVSKDALDKLKSKLKYSFIMSMDTPDATAGNIARFIAITGGIEGIETMYKTMDTITPEDIRNAAKKLTDNIKTTVTMIEEAK